MCRSREHQEFEDRWWCDVRSDCTPEAYQAAAATSPWFNGLIKVNGSKRNSHLLPSVTIRYHPLPSVTIRHHPLPSVTIRYHPLPSVTIRYHPSPSVTIRHHPLPSVTIRYHPASDLIPQEDLQYLHGDGSTSYSANEDDWIDRSEIFRTSSEQQDGERVEVAHLALGDAE